MIEKNKDKCVYIHKDSNGIVRYVGHGNARRPFEFTSTKRSKGWNSIFSLESPPTVEIIKDCLSFLEAVEMENSLIEKYSGTILNKRKSNTTRKIHLSDIEEYFYYDETSPSCLRWREVNNLQSKSQGDVAGYVLDKKSSNKKYWRVHFLGNNYPVHRFVWILKTKNDDVEHLLIDHIDGDGLNNNFNNLRACNHHENCHNKKCQSNNKLGLKNITKKSENTYRVSFTRYGITYRGIFETEIDAIVARDFALSDFEKFINDPAKFGMHKIVNKRSLE